MIHPIRFFSIEKEEYPFPMGLKSEWTKFECFIWNVLLMFHYINEFFRIINWNNLNETFQAYRKNYSIVTRNESFFLVMWLFRSYRILTKILANWCYQKKGLWVRLFTVGKIKLEMLLKSWRYNTKLSISISISISISFNISISISLVLCLNAKIYTF